MSGETQSFAVKRAQVEFHNFASLGEPERNLAIYAEENVRRGTVIRNHRKFIGGMTPFLEIGANAGHTSYMLANEFGAAGFALDLSADSLRHGRALMNAWGLERAPLRIAGDAANLPFTDSSLRLVCAFQMLSQFMDIESVFREVARVLAPGGVFLFAEEPLRRKLSLRLYRCPYYDTMKPWERKLYDWGLLGFLVRDVIGAGQEESFGIRQNHTMGLAEWDALARKYFAAQEYEIFVPQRGFAERAMKFAARSEWRAARWLGGTLAAVCRKAGAAPAAERTAAGVVRDQAERTAGGVVGDQAERTAGGVVRDQATSRSFDHFERLLRCPDCHGALVRGEDDVLECGGCGYRAVNEGEVYNLLPSPERSELYPGERDDIIDFSLPSHARQLLEGWYELEGVFGNKYRWIGGRAAAKLRRVASGPQRLRIRGHASAQGVPGEVRARVNGSAAGAWKLDRPGLFVLEADVPETSEYLVEIEASPTWTVPTDDRVLSVNLSMIRLVSR